MIRSMKTCSRTWQISGHICDQNGCKLESCFNMTHLSGSGGRGLWRLSSSLQFILSTLLLSSLLVLFFFSTLGPLHSSHHLTHYTTVCLLLCLSHHRGLPRIHSVLTSPICVSLSASPFCIAVWRILLISIHLYSHPLIPSVHWLLFNVLFNSFVSPVSLQPLNNSLSVPPGLPTSTFFTLFLLFPPSLPYYSPFICKIASCFHYPISFW